MATDCSIECGGECCRSFVIYATPERIAELHEQAKAYLASVDPLDAYSRDLVTIGEMLIRIPSETETPRYTCKHLSDAGLCGIYERRPKMCREYPYEIACDKCGATNPQLATAGASGESRQLLHPGEQNDD